MEMWGPGLPGAGGRGRVQELVPQPGTRVSLGLTVILFTSARWRVNCYRSIRRGSQNFFFFSHEGSNLRG